ncbi:MAG TPA: anti-anti-sigma factor [Desulfobacteraceae bacterium]|nr:anti-anti-sigma factor [Desulfobacteraceae bacterium]|tara:strand:- start:378 stop:1103 length:726 start_codon:yes stop_codon:yes gene_type:complete
MKILVIDDERPTLAMFKLFLAAYGYEVFTAESGEQGMAVFASKKPDIVFTDIRMPGMDGLEVLRQIRETGAFCQVVIITGHGDMERAMAALDLDASDFINKPVERAALNSALIRAEKRLERMASGTGTGEDAGDFSVTQDAGTGQLTLCFGGRLTESSEAKLDKLFTAAVPGDKVVCRFADDFSINRQGISLLVSLLRRFDGSGSHITISGLSYNYIRFFEMAGIDKLATLVPEDVEEPGL